MAAQCVETAVELEAGVRKRVEKRLARLVPPGNAEDVARLVALGQLPGPPLVRALGIAEPSQKAHIVIVLAKTNFEPAVEQLVKLLKEPASVEVGGEELQLDDITLLMLLEMASRSEIAFQALKNCWSDRKIRSMIVTSAEFSTIDTIAESAKRLVALHSS